MAPRALRHHQRKNIFNICKSGRSADLPDLLFHGKGRNGKRYLLTLAPCGSIRVSMKICGCSYGFVAQATQNWRNTKNPLAERLGFFVWSPTALGSERGEQPLSRCGVGGVQREGGGTRNTSPCLWPSGASPAAMIFIKAMKPVLRDRSLHKKQLFL